MLPHCSYQQSFECFSKAYNLLFVNVLHKILCISTSFHKISYVSFSVFPEGAFKVTILSFFSYPLIKNFFTDSVKINNC